MNKKKLNLENVYDQLSQVDNLDDILKDEGIVPEEILAKGLKRLEGIKSDSAYKSSIMTLIKRRISESVSSEARTAIESLKELIPSMSVEQATLVFRSLDTLSHNPQEIDRIVKELRSDPELQSIMDKYHPKKGR